MTDELDVRIGAIVVRGVPAPDAQRLGPAVTAELERALRTGAPGAPPHRLEGAIAEAVRRELAARGLAP